MPGYQSSAPVLLANTFAVAAPADQNRVNDFEYDSDTEEITIHGNFEQNMMYYIMVYYGSEYDNWGRSLLQPVNASQIVVDDRDMMYQGAPTRVVMYAIENVDDIGGGNWAAEIRYIGQATNP